MKKQIVEFGIINDNERMYKLENFIKMPRELKIFKSFEDINVENEEIVDDGKSIGLAIIEYNDEGVFADILTNEEPNGEKFINFSCMAKMLMSRVNGKVFDEVVEVHPIALYIDYGSAFKGIDNVW